jgi:LPS export ABC transporter protein LptC
MPGRYSYLLFWFAMMLIAGWGTYYALMNQPDIDPADRISKTPENEIGSISARTTRVEEIASDGRVRWILESVDLNGNVQGEFRMTHPKALIQVDDETSITLTAPEGNYNQKASEMRLSGGVKAVRNDDLSTFWAEEIFFSGEDAIMQSAGGSIKLARGDWEFHAEQIIVDLSGERVFVNLSGPVQIVNFKK